MAHSPQNFMLMGAIQHGSCTIQPAKVPYGADEFMDMIKLCGLNRINIYSPQMNVQIKRLHRQSIRRWEKRQWL